MESIQKLCHKRMITVIAAIFLVNTALYAIRFMWITPYDNEISEKVEEYDERELEAMFAARQRNLKHQCLMKGQKPPHSVVESTFPGRTIVETSHQILYCPVEKVGSSFWTRTLIAMNSQGRFTSPFKVKRSKKYELERYQNFQKSSKQDGYLKNWFMKNAVSLLVVRDPYTKLFSAYVDKLYHPNYLFWKITGQKIKNRSKNRKGSKCGNDITFSDFIKYIITETNKGIKLNPHFTPIHEHCPPCKIKYDYIMKFENFGQDLYYILGKWNARFNLNISFTHMESAETIASKHINISFSTIKQYSTKCNIPIYNFLLRTWRFLQITGILPKEAIMPFQNNENITQVTRENLLAAVKDVLSDDIDWTEVKKQRHEALVQAYQSISIQNIRKLQKIVKSDCQYFGYDENPWYLFEEKKETFNYFDGINML